MKGRARRKRQDPTPVPPPRAWSIVPPIMGADEIMALLTCGRSHLDELLRKGMPAVNIGFEHRAGKRGRTRRMLRFEPAAVIAWLRQRQNGNAA